MIGSRRWRQPVLIAMAAVIMLGSAAVLQAQPDADSPQTEPAAEETTGSVQPPVATTTRPPGVYPPNPRPFFRGYPPAPGQPPVMGHYLSLWRVFLVLGGYFLFVRISHWLDEDSRTLKVRSDFWNSVVLGGGLVGFLAALTMPSFYLLGFPLMLLATGVPIGLYIRERNLRVPESARVLTPAHIRRLVLRKLAQLGIQVQVPESNERVIGPPIRFIGKSTSGPGYDESRSRQVENSKGYLAAKELVADAILRRSTDVHLEPKGDEMAVRLRIDGVMYPTEPFDRGVGEAVVNIFKVLGAMDITEKRRPQDGSFRAEMDGREIDFRVATQGTRHGEKLSLRILDQSTALGSLANLGLRKQLLESIRNIIHQPHGMFLSCGPTGAGKSTTLYAALNEIDAYQRNIITVEDPIEYKIDNVTQIEINTRSGQSFGTALRSILRQDPDVVMVGEIRDTETAKIACQAATTGHMVFSTVHANDTITALYRLLDLGVEPFMVASSISAILGQRLARRLCRECRVAYKPSPKLLKQLNLPADKISRFYRAPKNPEQICPTCGGLGYQGRIGVFELLVITERMRDMIREKAPASAIRAEARKNGMLYMREEGLRLVVRGITSLDELQRVVQ